MNAVITGSSRGIGLGIAKELLKKDFTVILSARKESTEIQKIMSEYKDKVFFVPCDISVMQDVENLVSKTVETFGKVDVLVNNAGVLEAGLKPIDCYEDEDLEYGNMKVVRVVFSDRVNDESADEKAKFTMDITTSLTLSQFERKLAKCNNESEVEDLCE